MQRYAAVLFLPRDGGVARFLSLLVGRSELLRGRAAHHLPVPGALEATTRNAVDTQARAMPCGLANYFADYICVGEYCMLLLQGSRLHARPRRISKILWSGYLLVILKNSLNSMRFNIGGFRISNDAALLITFGSIYSITPPECSKSLRLTR